MSYQPMNYGYPYQDRLAQLQSQYQQAVNVPQIQQMQQPPQTNQGLLWVSGEIGAKSYLVAPNSTVLLMDSDSSKFYIKSADNSGMPNLRIFEYKEITNIPQNTSQVLQESSIDLDNKYVTRDEYNRLKSQYESISKRLEAIDVVSESSKVSGKTKKGGTVNEQSDI